MLHSRGVAVSHYFNVVFYLMLFMTVLSFLDVWIGLIPTRLTYVLPTSLICNACIVYPSWGLRFNQIALIVFLTSTMSLLIGILVHLGFRLVWLHYRSAKPRQLKDNSPKTMHARNVNETLESTSETV